MRHHLKMGARVARKIDWIADQCGISTTKKTVLEPNSVEPNTFGIPVGVLCFAGHRVDKGLPFQFRKSQAPSHQVAPLVFHLVAFAVEEDSPVKSLQQIGFGAAGRDRIEGVRSRPFGDDVRRAIAGDGVVPLRVPV